MTDLLIQLTLSNLVLSAALAGVAYLVHRHGRYPVLAHLLWVLVLVKLVTPPLFRLPVVPVSDGSLAIAETTVAIDSSGAGAEAAGGMVGAGSSIVGMLAENGTTALIAFWAIGSIAVLVISMVRIARFDRLLKRTSRPASQTVTTVAAGVAWQLGLKRPPTVYESTARLSPLTWWTGGAS